MKRTYIINYDCGSVNLNRTFIGTEKKLYQFIAKMEFRGMKNITYYQQ